MLWTNRQEIPAYCTVLCRIFRVGPEQVLFRGCLPQWKQFVVSATAGCTLGRSLIYRFFLEYFEPAEVLPRGILHPKRIIVGIPISNQTYSAPT